MNMNLGTLVTIADRKPANLYHFVFDNGVYGGTGGQPVAGAEITKYADMAKDAGYAAAFDFDNIEDFASSLKKIMETKGPVLIALRVTYGGRMTVPGVGPRPEFKVSFPRMKQALAASARK
jgi:phosphonopyruvate decarboxylase